jgi:hypothetical protein
MTDADDEGSDIRPRWVLSREPPFWVVTFFAPGLPAEGIKHRCRTHDEACEAWYHLYPEEFAGKGVVDPEYDLGPEIEAKYAAYHDAFRGKLTAKYRYDKAALAITTALADEQGVSLRDIASILHASYWRVSQMHAWEPMHVQPWLERFVLWIRPYKVQRLAALSANRVGTLSRQARIIAADSIRRGVGSGPWRS